MVPWCDAPGGLWPPWARLPPDVFAIRRDRNKQDSGVHEITRSVLIASPRPRGELVEPQAQASLWRGP